MMVDLRPTQRVDGNAAAGTLLAVFGRDVTAAEATCRHCGRVAMMAEAVAEVDADGVILLCRGCRHTLLRYVATAGAEVLATPGLAEVRWTSGVEDRGV